MADKRSWYFTPITDENESHSRNLCREPTKKTRVMYVNDPKNNLTLPIDRRYAQADDIKKLTTNTQPHQSPSPSTSKCVMRIVSSQEILPFTSMLQRVTRFARLKHTRLEGFPDYSWKLPTHPSSPNTTPAMIPSPNDDVRSAAIALTSLSLSPLNLTKQADDSEASTEKLFFFSPNNTFSAFPPHNTPTEEYVIKSRYVPTITMNKESRDKLTNQLDAVQKKAPLSLLSPLSYSSDTCNMCPDHFPPVKPRSYSTSRDFQYTPARSERISKQRSYSFDAVGRAHKYVAGMYERKDQEVLISQCGHHSPPRYHRDSTGSDDGIGSSAGSADSMEALPYKRKLHRTVFRCMWRGCEKELTTLSGIILHVRHEHIGPSRAGEEEFYFNDVNVESQTTSGVSSTSSNESLVEAPSSLLSVEKSTDSLGLSHIDKHQSHAINIPTVTVTPYTTNENSDSGTTNIVTAEHSNSDNFANKKAKSFCRIQKPPSLAKTLDSPNFSMDFSNMYRTSPDEKSLIVTTEKKMKRRKSSGKKKCRKVYGMSNKDLWCTQCRWKKACVRFL